jgi:tight adherence protein C
MLFAPSAARELERARYRLELAGLRRDDSLDLYYCVRFLGAFGVLALGLFGWWLETLSIAMAFLLAVAALYLPDLLLRLAAQQREQQVLRALPDFIDLSTICMSAGLGWMAAVRRVVDQLAETHPAICQEFGYLLDQTQTGMARAEALRELYRRNPSREIGQLVQVLIQNERLGSAVSAALTDFSRRLYAEREQSLEEKAGKVAAKMALITLPFLLLPFMLLLTGEQMVKLLRALI